MFTNLETNSAPYADILPLAFAPQLICVRISMKRCNPDIAAGGDLSNLPAGPFLAAIARYSLSVEHAPPDRIPGGH